MGENYVIKRVEGNPSFLKKHSRWLTFLSTVVVLGTFIVNDALVDSAKDLSSSLTEARSAFVMRSREEVMLNQLETTWENMEDVRTGSATSWHAWEYGPDFQRLNSEYSPLLDLYNKLPYDKTLDELHWQIKYLIAIAKAWEDEEMAEGEIDPRPGHLRSQQLETGKQEAIDKQFSALAKTLNIHETNDTTILSKVDDVFLDSAERSQESAEKLKTIGKHLGYVLYPTGVLLGLLGKLYGGGESEAEEVG